MGRRAKVETEFTGDASGFVRTSAEVEKIVGKMSGKLGDFVVSAFSAQALIGFGRRMIQNIKQAQELATELGVSVEEADRLRTLSAMTGEDLKKMTGSAEALQDALRRARELSGTFFTEEDVQAVQSFTASLEGLQRSALPVLEVVLEKLKNLFDLARLFGGGLSAGFKAFAETPGTLEQKWEAANDAADKAINKVLDPYQRGAGGAPRGPGATGSLPGAGGPGGAAEADLNETGRLSVELAKLQTEAELEGLSVAERRARIEEEIADQKKRAAEIEETIRRTRFQPGTASDPERIKELLEARIGILKGEKELRGLQSESAFRTATQGDSLARIGGFVGGGKTSIKDGTRDVIKRLDDIHRALTQRGIKVQEL